MKWILLFTWIFVIIVFSFNYQLFSESYFRLRNPNKVFHAPKPFKLLNITGTLDILGGERPTIIIKSSTTIPDTVFLFLTPTQVSTKKRDSLKLKFYSPPKNSGEYILSNEKCNDFSEDIINIPSWVVDSNSEKDFVQSWRPGKERSKVFSSSKSF